MGNSLEVPQKATQSPWDGQFRSEAQNLLHMNTWIGEFTATIFPSAPKWKETKCPSKDKYDVADTQGGPLFSREKEWKADPGHNTDEP